MERSTATSGIVYDLFDVSRILGLPAKNSYASTPVPQRGEIVIYYGGWTLKDLRMSKAGRKHMRHGQTWYDDTEWKAETGYYRLLLPVPMSNRKDFNRQRAHIWAIDHAWTPAPVAVAVSALLVHLAVTGNDLLQGDWCRCAESLSPGSTVVITVEEDGRSLIFNDSATYGSESLWLAAAQKC